MSINLITPNEMAKHIATQARKKRLALNLSQQSLSKRSAVSYGSLKKFEQTGKISLESLLKLALVLDAMDEFTALFNAKAEIRHTSLEDLLKDNSRKRGRK